MRRATPYAIACSLFVWLSVACATNTAVDAEARVGSSRLPGYIRGHADTRGDRVIIFVHGIFGDGRTTWTNSTTGAYFPELVATDGAFAGTSIWVHDFPSPKLAGSYSIDELADHLRRHLSHDNVLRNHRDVVFVAHSMGGLVVRAFLLKYRDLLPPKRVPMLYFFSTPSTGADIASYTRLVSMNPQLGDMRKVRTNRSGVLATYDAQWSSSEYMRVTRTFCAYETLSTFGIQVVQRESAEHLCNTRPDPIRNNHVDIVKPADSDAESFVALRDAYREVFEPTSPSISKRRPVWNVRSQAPAFVRVSAAPAKPSCRECWSTELEIAAGDTVFVAIHYENFGQSAARNTRLLIEAPTDPMSEPLIYATLNSEGASPFQSAACVVPRDQPFVLVPLDAVWYPNGSEDPLPLPYEQTAAAAMSQDGLALGDVNTGRHFASDVVIQYRAVPIAAIAMRGLEKWGKRAMETIQSRAGVIDARELGELALQEGLRVEPGAFDFTQDLERAAWTSNVDAIRRGEAFMVILFVSNAHAETIRDAVVVGRQQRRSSTGRETLNIELRASNYTSELVNVPLSFDGAATLEFLAALEVPEDFCARPSSLAEIARLRRDGNIYTGIPLGDIPPESVVALGLVLRGH